MNMFLKYPTANGTKEVYISVGLIESFEVFKDISGEPTQFILTTQSGKVYTGLTDIVQNFEKVYRKLGS